MVFFPTATKKSGSDSVVAFPDVCKVPAPPAPFVPTPYPNVQFEKNLKAANKVDAEAKSGSKTARKQQATAIDNLKKATGRVASSATQAVLLGKTAHAKYEGVPVRVRIGGIRHSGVR